MQVFRVFIFGTFFIVIGFIGFTLCFPNVVQKWADAIGEENKRIEAEQQRAEAQRDHRAGYEAMVCRGVQNRVRDQLLAPSTADFEGCWSHTTQYQGNGDYLVRFYVDAQNGFGAKIRKYFDAEVHLAEPTPDSPVNWTLHNLTSE